MYPIQEQIEIIEDILKLTKTFSKKVKEKLRNFIRQECPYNISNLENKVIIKNRDYRIIYESNENKLPSQHTIKKFMQLYKNKDIDDSYFYLYNDGCQPYKSITYLKTYLQELRFLAQFID